MVVMSWEIVVGIGTLSGFVFGAVKFITPLTNAITMLTQECQHLTANMQRLENEKIESEKEIYATLGKLRDDAHDGRKRIWSRIDEQQDTLQEHGRILQDHANKINFLEKNI